MGSYVVRGCSLWLVVVVVLSPGEEWGDTGTGPGWSDFNAGAVEGKPQLIWSSQSVSQSVSQWRLSREMRDRGDQLAVISRSEREIWTRVTVWPGYHPPSPSLTITEQPERRNWFDLSFNLGDHDHAISCRRIKKFPDEIQTFLFPKQFSEVMWHLSRDVMWCDMFHHSSSLPSLQLNHKVKTGPGGFQADQRRSTRDLRDIFSCFQLSGCCV